MALYAWGIFFTSFSPTDQSFVAVQFCKLINVLRNSMFRTPSMDFIAPPNRERERERGVSNTPFIS